MTGSTASRRMAISGALLPSISSVGSQWKSAEGWMGWDGSRGAGSHWQASGHRNLCRQAAHLHQHYGD